MINVAKTVIIKDENYLLIKRALNPKKPFSEQWDFPGGKIELDEEPEDCAIRETKEETGLEVVLDSLVLEGDHTENGEKIHYKIYSTISHTGKVKLSEDHSKYAWVKREQIQKRDSTPFVKAFFASS